MFDKMFEMTLSTIVLVGVYSWSVLSTLLSLYLTLCGMVLVVPMYGVFLIKKTLKRLV